MGFKELLSKKISSIYPEHVLSMPDVVEDDDERVAVIPGKKPTLYEKFVYFFDILVPSQNTEDVRMRIPDGSFVQKVIYGKKKRVRIMKQTNYVLTHQRLVEPKETETYRVILDQKDSWFSVIDLTSPFIRRWDNFTLFLLLFTAIVTPFETAFTHISTSVDTMFLINRLIDISFLIDMTIQIRTPFRDSSTGLMVYNKSEIVKAYLKKWFIIDLLSVIPFETLSFDAETDNVEKLSLLRFFRLARLLKLLRIFRANKKLQRIRVHAKMNHKLITKLMMMLLVLFVTHWLACGYRLASDRNNPLTDAPGWVERYAKYANTTNVDTWTLYLLSVFWSTSQVTLIGSDFAPLQPLTVREWGYSLFAQFISYAVAISVIASLADLQVHANKRQRIHELKIDKYLKMFEGLQLDPSVKFKVYEYLNDIHALEDQSGYQELLRQLPIQWNGIINLEINLPFLAQIPFLEPFIDREPGLMIDLCRCVEIRAIPPNSMLFYEGYDGIYRLDKGIVCCEGIIYKSGDLIGEVCTRERVKKSEARALTNSICQFLPRDQLLSHLAKHPKVRYYVRRWTCWQLVRLYIKTYRELYFLAASRGALMDPPLFSGRGTMSESGFDDIDFAVMDHMEKWGY